ncbi:hypothetical protein SAMN05444166_1615 [Singulisphaera sp. GP187]|uniref:tetratricopeptide repeat protein n=1 Tax=Singulisphaera sp. GP187 TaxID=1882752 RepID=UPI000928E59F|nr:hypothetical protein [Singulisphaera sp. GP187]SIN92017.1 hypothetical protein SAMN05444166_1615 [Singulisphaera sp. GP187]
MPTPPPGGEWQLVPSRAAGFVWIDGRSVEATCPLPFDVPFRVGEHWLTLRPTGAASPEWHAYKSPAPTASTIVREEVRPPVTPPRGRDDPSDLFEFTAPPPPRPTPAPEYDPVSRWKENAEKRSKRSDVSPEERRWENRWRAAGERVRARPPVAATPLASPPPVATTPPEELTVRRASLDAAELRTRTWRGSSPVDRRASITEIPPSVPPVPTLTAAPLVEISPPSTPPYHVPRLPRVDLPTTESRSEVVSAPDLPVDPSSSALESLPSLTHLEVGPEFSFAEPIEETFLGIDRLDPSPAVEQSRSVESPSEGVIDTLVAPQAGGQSVDEIDVPTAAAWEEDQTLAAESTETGVLTETWGGPDRDGEALTPPSFAILSDPAPSVVEASALLETPTDPVGFTEALTLPSVAVFSSPAAVVDDSVLLETDADPVGAAAEIVTPLSSLILTEPAAVIEESRFVEIGDDPVRVEEVITPPPSLIPSESVAVIEERSAGVSSVESLVEAGGTAPASSATFTAPIESPGIVTDSRLGDPAGVILEETTVDLTTSVHDACGLSRTAKSTVSSTSIETDPVEDPSIAGAQASAPTTPLADWAVRFDDSARDGSGSTTKETIPPPSSRDWPTVRDILASHNASVKRATAPRAMVRPALIQPILTEPREPAHWTFPLWLGWPPALLAVLVFGMAGVALSCIWSVDARWSGSVASLLAGGAANVKPLPESVPTPGGAWWRSSAANLMLWSLYFDRRPADDPLNAEQAKKLLNAASQASPIQAQVRFALARQARLDDHVSSFNPSLGLSQDIEAQTWLGHQCLQAGKKEAAIKVYRRALEMAARADLSRVVTPSFDEDTQILRYHLPSEEITRRVIRDMAEQTSWTFSDWKEALPPFAPIPLAAARFLRERGSADADAALGLILSRLDAPRLEGTSASLHLAAQAEAFAFKSLWNEAKTRYEKALELMSIDAIKRSWWMNLAEIERRLNDDSGRLTALELARGNNANDEISQRAVDLMRYSGTRTDKVRAQR